MRPNVLRLPNCNRKQCMDQNGFSVRLSFSLTFVEIFQTQMFEEIIHKALLTENSSIAGHWYDTILAIL